jgi:hypothetical protein
MKPIISPDLLIGASDSMGFFERVNKRRVDSSDKSEARSVQRIRQRYRPYCSKRFQFLAANCTNDHFFVVQVIFDIREDTIFEKVTLYDSLRRPTRNNSKVNKNSVGAQFLMQLQLFLSLYCFYRLFAEELMTKISGAGREYLENIPASQWRNTAWLEDPTLPPMYGVKTSNMSESTNSMFEKSRDGSWLYSLHTMLSKMVERIACLRNVHKGKTGVVDKVAGKVKDR